MSYKEKLNMTQGCACTDITLIHLASQGVLGGRKGLGASPSVFSWKHAEHINLSCQEEQVVGLRENCWTTQWTERLRTHSAACDLPSLMPRGHTLDCINIEAHFLNAQVVGFLEDR